MPSQGHLHLLALAWHAALLGWEGLRKSFPFSPVPPGLLRSRLPPASWAAGAVSLSLFYHFTHRREAGLGTGMGFKHSHTKRHKTPPPTFCFSFAFSGSPRGSEACFHASVGSPCRAVESLTSASSRLPPLRKDFAENDSLSGKENGKKKMPFWEGHLKKAQASHPTLQHFGHAAACNMCMHACTSMRSWSPGTGTRHLLPLLSISKERLTFPSLSTLGFLPAGEPSPLLMLHVKRRLEHSEP